MASSSSAGCTQNQDCSSETPPFEDVRKSEDVERQAPVLNNNGPRYSSYTIWEKRAIVLAAALASFFSPLTAQIYLPALPLLADDLGVSNGQINLTITTYMIFQAITPMFIGSLADSGGRRPAYLICFVLYVAANIGLALAPGYGAILGLRCLQSAGSSSTVALCTAVVADVVTSAERGQYVGFTAVPAVLAPALGPVIGGLLSQKLGWRSIFWFLVISSGVAISLIALFFPETCRAIVGDGSTLPPRLYRTPLQIMRRRQKSSTELTRTKSASSVHNFKFKLPNILGSLFMLFEKETGLLLWSCGLVFAGFYCLATGMPTLLSERYGYDQITVGLMYLPLAGGSVVAVAVVGPAINWNFKRHCIKNGIPYDRSRQQDLSDFPLERARLEISFPMLGFAGVCLIAWGWAVNEVAHVAVLCILSFLAAIGIVGFNNSTNVLLVDLHPGHAGTATAANNLTRCLIGAGATAAIVPMIDAMGPGGAFSLVGGVYIACGAPLFLLFSKGMKWRQELKAKEDRKAKAKEEARRHTDTE